MTSRRSVIRSAAALPLAAWGLKSEAAAAYPSKPITILVAFGPGGAGDVIARTVGQKLSSLVGQPVVVDNRPGAGAVIAAMAVAKAKPDGYTALLSGNGTSLSAVLFKKLPYSLNGDFKHVSSLANFDLGLVVDGSSPFKTVQDVLAYAKANPGRLTIGTARIGSTQQLSAELFKSKAGVDAVIVPYSSTSEMLTGLRGKDIQLGFEVIPPILGQIGAKSVRVLGVTSTERFPGLPDVPTIAESGVPGFEATSWAGISVPAKTSPEVIDTLAKAIQQAVASPDVQTNLQSMGYVAKASTPAEMSARITADMAKWKDVIEKAHIPLE